VLGSPRGVATYAARSDAVTVRTEPRAVYAIARSPSAVEPRRSVEKGGPGLEAEDENVLQDVFHSCISTLVTQCGAQAVAHDLLRAILHEFACDPRMGELAMSHEAAPKDALSSSKDGATRESYAWKGGKSVANGLGSAVLRSGPTSLNEAMWSSPVQRGGKARSESLSLSATKRVNVENDLMLCGGSTLVTRRERVHSQSFLDAIRINLNTDGELRHRACQEVKDILGASSARVGGWFRECVLPESAQLCLSDCGRALSSSSSSALSSSAPAFAGNVVFSEGSDNHTGPQRRQARVASGSAASSFGGMVMDAETLDEFAGSVAVLFRSLIPALGNENVQDRDREESEMFESLSRDVQACNAPVVSYVFQRALALVLGEECSFTGNRSPSVPRSSRRSLGRAAHVRGSGECGRDWDADEDADEEDDFSSSVAARLREEIAGLRQELAGVRAQLEAGTGERPRAGLALTPVRRHSSRLRGVRRATLPRRWSMCPGADSVRERA
jgi:hypothetical protein